MNINGVIESILAVVEKVRAALPPLPGILLLCTASRRAGLSSILMAAEAFADTNVDSPFDDILKGFIYNVVNRIKLNIQDDGVCFVAIPPGGLRFSLQSGNAGGPIVLDGSNTNYVFTYAIIR